MVKNKKDNQKNLMVTHGYDTHTMDYPCAFCDRVKEETAPVIKKMKEEMKTDWEEEWTQREIFYSSNKEIIKWIKELLISEKKKIVEEIDKIMELEPDWVKLKRKLLK